jgi:PhnB protein
VYVPDVDATVDRAVANGARVLVPLEDQFWGDRIAWLIDPAGHVWTVASRIEETTAEERTSRWTSILAGGEEGE